MTKFIKPLLILLLSVALFIVHGSLFIATAHGEGEFITDSKVEYKVDQSQKTTVTHEITLENAFSTMYATAYSIVLQNINPQNPRAYDSNGSLPLSVSKEGDNTTLKVTFNDPPLVGKGMKRVFNLAYEEGSFAVRTGEVWEIFIPKLDKPDSFRNYAVVMKVPLSFGQEAYVSPAPISTSEGSGFKVYTFDKNSVSQTGITAGFGQFQVFSFTLNYHLENPLAKASSVDVALPPDSAFQKVYYQTASPEPVNVRVDEDGNWLATYSLKPRELKDIAVSGSVQIFSFPRAFPKPSSTSLQKNLQNQEFWESNDPQIITIAKTLKNPKAIYDYVSTTLSYDYKRVTPNVERLGAKAILSQPKMAICMEYTDLFIALSRAAGIPAREINGYAYTENKDIQPVSLVADVLHSWPEYWDKDKAAWIPVDPTWGSTTGGVDFFSKLDLRHFAFVIHGQSSQKPYPAGSYKLGSNPQKDVFVSFGQLPSQKVSSPKFTTSLTNAIPFANSHIIVTITNPGPEALYNLSPLVLFDGKNKDSRLVEVLPPFAKYQMEISVPFSFLGQNTPSKITIVLGDKHIDVPTFKNQVIIDNLIVLFIVFALILLFVFIKVKKITLESVLSKFRKNDQIIPPSA